MRDYERERDHACEYDRHTKPPLPEWRDHFVLDFLCESPIWPARYVGKRRDIRPALSALRRWLAAIAGRASDYLPLVWPPPGVVPSPHPAEPRPAPIEQPHRMPRKPQRRLAQRAEAFLL